MTLLKQIYYNEVSKTRQVYEKIQSENSVEFTTHFILLRQNVNDWASNKN